MPMPKPNAGEAQKDFVERFMSAMADEYPDEKQRYAVAMQQWKDKDKKMENEEQPLEYTAEVKTVYEIDNVEIFRAGKWNGDEYTTEDLDEIVKAHDEIGHLLKPYLKLGHNEGQKILKADGMPAAGWVTSIRRVGEALVARIVNVPEKIYQLILNKAYGRISSEIYWNLQEGGKKYPRVLRAVALLGGDTPAVWSMDDFSKPL